MSGIRSARWCPQKHRQCSCRSSLPWMLCRNGKAVRSWEQTHLVTSPMTNHPVVYGRPECRIAQSALAQEITSWVRGSDAAHRAAKGSELLYGGFTTEENSEG